MITVSKDIAKNFYYANILYEEHIVSEKLRLFEKKYNQVFKKFESALKKGREDFEKWDDYMEWKAYEKSFKKIIKTKKDIKSGNIKLS